MSLGEKEFSSIKDARNHVKKILWGHMPGKWLVGEEFIEIYDLIKHHPRAEEKIGYGIEAIQVTNEGNIGTARHFEIYRVDGTHTDVSYPACFGKKEKSNMDKFTAACREAISQDTVKFRRSVPLISWISGVRLTEQNCHVDHAHPWPFIRFVQWFMGAYNLDENKVKVVMSNRVGIYQFADPDIRQKCREYHDRFSILRLITDEENQALPKTREWGSWMFKSKKERKKK